MGVTLKDVAALAGVSPSAVSRTFTNGASVSARMRKKVEDAADALGYRPNRLASSLTTGRTKLIGLVADNFHNPIFLEVFDQFTRGLQDRGLRPLLVNLSAAEQPDAALSMLREYSVDGVVVASSTLAPAFARVFVEAGVPVVHAFGRQTAHPAFHIVGIDNSACGAMAFDTLYEQGYRRLGVLAGPADATSAQDRLNGFLASARRQADVSVTHSFAGAYAFEAGRLEMERLLSQGPPAEAYFCGDDVLSMGAMAALQAKGFRVPHDVGIIGLNDMAMAQWTSFDLTTIHQPVSEIVVACIDLIEVMMSENAPAPRCHLFDCHVVMRGTLASEPPDPQSNVGQTLR